VPPNLREKLEQRYDNRTHAATQAQIQKQRTESIDSTSDEWVHDVDNFFWKHQLVNCHEIFMTDILHQLFKGILMHVKSWTAVLLDGEMRDAGLARQYRNTKKRRTEKMVHSDIHTDIDTRFAQVPPYTGLRRFPRFSKLKQWTGKD